MYLTLASLVFLHTLDFYKQFGFLPPVEQIINIWGILEEQEPPVPGDDAGDIELQARREWEAKKKLVVWWCDNYLVAAGGELTYGKTVRYYKHLAEAVEVKGKKFVLVETTTEAYGMLVYDNCHGKWNEIFAERVKDPGFKIPKYSKEDASTHKYNVTKHTDPQGGKNAGWKDSGREALNAFKKQLKDFRANDRKNGYPLLKKALQWLREENGITEESYMPKRRGAKRKRQATVDKTNVVLLDEESDEWSAGPDDEASVTEAEEEDN